MKLYILILINVLLLSIGQVLYKIGLAQIGDVTLPAIIASLFSPYILGGLLIYGIATIQWFWILLKGPFSIVYPLQSLAYVLGIVAALIVFKEHIPVTRWIGAAFIIIGAFFIAQK